VGLSKGGGVMPRLTFSEWLLMTLVVISVLVLIYELLNTIWLAIS
jgi:diacylglycerol kinase